MCPATPQRTRAPSRGQLRRWDCVGVWGCQTGDLGLSSRQGEWESSQRLGFPAEQPSQVPSLR